MNKVIEWDRPSKIKKTSPLLFVCEVRGLIEERKDNVIIKFQLQSVSLTPVNKSTVNRVN